jgi:chaperonin cofactor prefoldin
MSTEREMRTEDLSYRFSEWYQGKTGNLQDLLQRFLREQNIPFEECSMEFHTELVQGAFDWDRDRHDYEYYHISARITWTTPITLEWQIEQAADELASLREQRENLRGSLVDYKNRLTDIENLKADIEFYVKNRDFTSLRAKTQALDRLGTSEDCQVRINCCLGQLEDIQAKCNQARSHLDSLYALI